VDSHGLAPVASINRPLPGARFPRLRFGFCLPPLRSGLGLGVKLRVGAESGCFVFYVRRGRRTLQAVRHGGRTLRILIP